MATDTLAEAARVIQSCSACRLCEGRTKAVPGEGNPHAKIMLVGEAPGANEDFQGRPFVGMAGQMLNAELEKAGLRREDVFITNVVKCRPPDNRKPKEDEVQACADFLRRQVDAVRPRLLVALGTSAFHALVDTKVPIGVARGKQFVSKLGVPVLATFHPSAILYNRSRKTGAIAQDLRTALADSSK